ncbi:amidohydrolase [Acinetobacter nosocomialis]|uniref:amidohydrolase n=1 Tax=Acinetobacter nosocomialis TaxID=106654 RepID=UPI0002CF98EB|nr:amidohydrolase [Acinetobacter nosocomialis]ENU47270.1 hypothetical protein F984_01639 [Acinetobacter nosocomialis NIPH 2119]QXC10667.1 amidohydrolase [Acinetobacter nosocomialis]
MKFFDKVSIKYIVGYSSLILSSFCFGQPSIPVGQLNSTENKAISIINGQANWLTNLYQDIHQHPELAFMEKRTSSLIAKELKSLGFEVKSGIAQTGVAAILRNGVGPIVMYRADMDALPMEEKTGLPYASKVKTIQSDGTETSVAHMCGHDAHVTWMLGMAKTMVALKKEWSGTIILIAQPAEEVLGGAKAMLADGLWENYKLPKPDYYFAVHTAPIPVGSVVNASGPLMAGTDQVNIAFKGIGGHGSSPFRANNPINMAANAITQYQSIITNKIDPQQPASLSVGSVQAGNANNVIPSKALVKMNIRWFDPLVRDKILDNINKISQGAAQMQGISGEQLPDVQIIGSSTPTINDKELTERLNQPLKALLGANQVITKIKPVMGSEDVQELLGKYHSDVPFAFLFIGVADPEIFRNALKQGKEMPYVQHSPNYIVDLKALPIGTQISAISMLELLSKK